MLILYIYIHIYIGFCLCVDKSTLKNMPKDIPFYKLSKRAKRNRLLAEDNESNSTDISSNHDPSHIQQLHTFAITHNIEEPDSHPSHHPNFDGFLCNDSELPDNSELSEQSDSEYWSNNDDYGQSDILHNIDFDPSPDRHSPSNSPNSSQCSENSVSSQLKILKFLRSWALKHNITHKAISDLLTGLQQNHECFAGHESKHKFPINARTLLKTEVKLIKKTVEPGYYIHIGLKKQLLKVAPKYLKNVSTFKLLMNIDGLPLFKSSLDQMYPILCTIVSIPELRYKVIPVGIYYGTEKPQDLNKYLQDFIAEVCDLIKYGLHFGNHTTILDGIYFVCDAPAKSYILGTVSHTGYHSCTRCTVRGVTSDNRRIFLDSESPTRTSKDFIEWRDPKFRRRSTPLTNIAGLDFVHHFILDYLHLQCLGVMHAMILNIWYKGPIPHRFTAAQIEMLSNHLIQLRYNIPTEFVRKCRELYIILRWKGTEFRLFMLNIGPVVLKNILSQQKYVHFLEFHCAMRILLNQDLCKEREFRQFAKTILKHFVRSTEILYHKNFISHNFHNNIHIADDAEYFSDKLVNFTLDTISAFPFENYMQSIKQKIRGRNKPLEQLGRRIGEIMKFDSEYPTEKPQDIFPKLFSPHNAGPMLPGCGRQYRGAVLPLFKITNKIPDNCCGTSDGAIIQVENVAFSNDLQIPVVIGRKFINKYDFYNVPIESSRLGIFKVKQLSNLKIWPLSQITVKYVQLPYKNVSIVSSILHCDIPCTTF